MEYKGSKIRCLELYYVIFRDEWISISNKSDNTQSWKHFIESKDLGVKCISHSEDKYEVIDENKWFLTRIKYGF